MGWGNTNNLITRMNTGVIREELGGKSQDLEPDNVKYKFYQILPLSSLNHAGSLNFSLLICKMGFLYGIKGILFI